MIIYISLYFYVNEDKHSRLCPTSSRTQMPTATPELQRCTVYWPWLEDMVAKGTKTNFCWYVLAEFICLAIEFEDKWVCGFHEYLEDLYEKKNAKKTHQTSTTLNKISHDMRTRSAHGRTSPFNRQPPKPVRLVQKFENCLVGDPILFGVVWHVSETVIDDLAKEMSLNRDKMAQRKNGPMEHWALDADPNDLKIYSGNVGHWAPTFFYPGVLSAAIRTTTSHSWSILGPFATSKVGSKKSWPLKRFQAKTEPKPAKKTTKLGISRAWAPWWCSMVHQVCTTSVQNKTFAQQVAVT